ncbi:MAG: glycerate kinase [Acidobacteriaceae bacterium]|nr:glycerate kinase [Acidobacteriaceae bacterium]
MKSTSRLRRDAIAIFRAALAAANAGNAVRRHLQIQSGQVKAGSVRLPLKNSDRIFLIGVGKAAIKMAASVKQVFGATLSGGTVVTKRGHATRRLRGIEIIEAGHPLPDHAGVQGSIAIQQLLRELNARDLLIVAISGGASALLPAPAERITLEAKQQTTDLLLKAGATIHELNAVRKHISTLKGGQLASLAYPATVVSLILSDVIGDQLDVIGSGPTAPDTSTFGDALNVLRKFGLMQRVPRTVRERLEQGARGQIAETPKPGDPLFKHVHNIVVGSNRLALKAAALEARSRGFCPLILSSTIEGETREVARTHAQILREVALSGNPVRPPACILSGGETTVTVRGGGRGGRNQEFALAAALELDGAQNLLVLSAGTDGTDGPTDAAGAIATGDTIERSRRLGLDAARHLAANDSYPFLDRLGDLVKTGPTGTNVMDVHVLLAG